MKEPKCSLFIGSYCTQDAYENEDDIYNTVFDCGDIISNKDQAKAAIGFLMLNWGLSVGDIADLCPIETYLEANDANSN